MFFLASKTLILLVKVIFGHFGRYKDFLFFDVFCCSFWKAIPCTRFEDTTTCFVFVLYVLWVAWCLFLRFMGSMVFVL